MGLHVGGVRHHIDVVVRVHEAEGPQAEGKHGEVVASGGVGEHWLPEEARDIAWPMKSLVITVGRMYVGRYGIVGLSYLGCLSL